ncbi:MAG TPA: orotate phosphoribosyltransferase [Nitrososphaeraceae archaeon]|jgi:orotate phosphoribosyltransferase|nr:orotate phosphoribosyltransferase [Nitrososphaeraceae archaeon]
MKYPNYEQLVEIIKNNGIVFQQITLTSNIQSDFYYDLKKILHDQESLHLIAGSLLEQAIKYNVKSIGGLELGSIPLTTAVLMLAWDKGVNLTGFTVRKNVKKHGLQKKIEGIVREPIMILEDVITSGKSVANAIDALLQEGYRVNSVVCVLDRQEESITNILKQRDISYISLFEHSEFKPYIEERLRNKKF